MIATRLGLAIALALACLLAIVLALDLRSTPNPIDRAIAPGFAADRVTALAWSGRHTIELVRDAAGWTWTTPPGRADARTVDDVLATLRGARWHRRAASDAAGTISEVLVVTAGAASLRVGIGAVLPGDEQQWLVIDGHALLVDRWVARSLAPEPLALRVRDPLANAADAGELAVGAVTLRGAPRQLVRGTDQIVVAPELVDQLERALTGLVVSRLPDAGIQRAPGLEIRVAGKLALVQAGSCATSRVLVDGPSGIGCVERESWQAIERAVAAFATPLEQLVERRPVPGDVMRVTLIDKSTLDLAKRPRLANGPGDDTDADPARVIELLAVLAAPAEPIALPTLPSIGQLAITTRSGFALTLDVYPNHIVARHGEPIALQLGAGAAAILGRPGSAFRDPTLWSEEPTTITEIALAGTTYRRGAVLGEWTRTGPGPDDPATVDKLVALLAAPRGLGPRTAVGATRWPIKVTVTPPTGAPSTHELTLDASPAGCGASTGKTTVVVASEICQLAASLRPR